MKKIIILVVFVAGFFFIFNYTDWWQIGPFGYGYGICEKGYYKYDKNIMDGGYVYYDSNGNKVGQSCGMYIEGNSDCEKRAQVVGKCTEVSPWKFFLTKKLGL